MATPSSASRRWSLVAQTDIPALDNPTHTYSWPGCGRGRLTGIRWVLTAFSATSRRQSGPSSSTSPWLSASAQRPYCYHRVQGSRRCDLGHRGRTDIEGGLLRSGTRNIGWSAEESLFRFLFDNWTIRFGLWTAIEFVIHECSGYQAGKPPPVTNYREGVSRGSVIGILRFSAFELLKPLKSTCNRWYPCVSWILTISFAILRNVNTTRQSASSQNLGDVYHVVLPVGGDGHQEVTGRHSLDGGRGPTI